MKLIIPKGWVLLTEDEVGVKGLDLCTRNSTGSLDLSEWEEVDGIAERKSTQHISDEDVKFYEDVNHGYIIIRPMTHKEGMDGYVPDFEKEWLNPWD